MFISDCAGFLLLCRPSSSCGEQGLIFIAVCRLLSAVASLVADLRLQGMQASAVVVCGLQLLQFPGSRAQAQ